MGRLSKSGSMRMKTVLRVAAVLCIAAVAVSLPSGAGAKASPPGQQKQGKGRDKHPDHKNGKRGPGQAPVQESPAPEAPAAAPPGDATAPGSGDSHPVTAYRIPAVKVDDGVAIFRLSGITPKSIRAAYVKRGERKRRLSLRRVRAAARRGVLRLRVAGLRSSRRDRQATVSRRRAKKKRTTLIVVTDPPATTTPPATTPPPEPEPEPAPAPAPAPAPITTWRPVGSLPLSDAEAAARVTARAEVRPGNVSANRYLPTQSELAAFHNAVYGAGPNAGRRADAYNPLIAYVTGGFTGTTDEILQWAANKWGIPVDVLRAVAINESYWRQDALGDREDGVNASLYPAQARIDSDSVYESMGITQIKWRPNGSLNPGTEPLRWKSTSFNADYWGANVRYYYDGYCSWCSPGYAPGQAWESIGAHYDPSPWRNSGMLDYITRIQGYLAARDWEKSGF